MDWTVWRDANPFCLTYCVTWFHSKEDSQTRPGALEREGTLLTSICEKRKSPGTIFVRSKSSLTGTPLFPSSSRRFSRATATRRLFSASLAVKNSSTSTFETKPTCSSIFCCAG
jgi:hypothetical protein